MRNFSRESPEYAHVISLATMSRFLPEELLETFFQEIPPRLVHLWEHITGDEQPFSSNSRSEFRPDQDSFFQFNNYLFYILYLHMHVQRLPMHRLKIAFTNFK